MKSTIGFKTFGYILFFVIIFGGAGLAGVFYFRNYEANPPEITLLKEPRAIGRDAIIEIKLFDKGLGLKDVSVTFVQGSLTKEIFKESIMKPPAAKTGTLEATVGVRIAPLDIGAKDGQARIIISATDRSWRAGGAGNRTDKELSVAVKTKPPRGEVLTTQHNVYMGGSELVIYKIQEDVTEHGIKVGDRLFPGQRSEKSKDICIAFFAIPHDADPKSNPRLWLKDAVGNESLQSFYHQIIRKQFPQVPITVSEIFVDKIRGDFSIPTGMSSKDAFLEVNSKRRVEDHEKILELCKKSQPKRLWEGVFLRPPSATKSVFAERRLYSYNGEQIDGQNHLGVDLASLANSPVMPVAKGVVVFEGDLGIYGNTVIIDHGLGVFSLYGHLATILAPEEGSPVTTETVIGRTGTTGLALGDHVHFGVLVQGIPVNPIEWWDPLWMEKHVNPKIKMFEEGTGEVEVDE